MVRLDLNQTHELASGSSHERYTVASGTEQRKAFVCRTITTHS